MTPHASTSAPAAELWAARLIGLTASYGDETWKYDLAYEGQAQPNNVIDHLENRTSSYAGSLGLRASLRIEIYETENPEQVADTTYNVSASIPTLRGNLFAYVKRESATSNMFVLDFDLDGANNLDPFGRAPPPADPGLQNVLVSIHRRFNNPQQSSIVVGTSSLQFTYDRPATFAAVPQYAALAHVQAVPDGLFRLFNDVGWDRSVLLVTRPVNASLTVDLEYQFAGATNQDVELVGYVARRALPGNLPGAPAPPAPPLPPIPGITDNQTLGSLLSNLDRFVVIQNRTLGVGRTDATGYVRFQVTGADLLGVANPAMGGVLAAVAPVLRSNFDAAACPGDCLGGPQFRVGATELAVPVTDRRASIYSYRLVEPNLLGQALPPPVQDAAASVNALEVFVEDVTGFGTGETRNGDLYAVVADARSTKPLSSASLSPSLEDDLLSGQLPVRPIQDQRVSHYRVFAFLYTDSDEFYGLTFGDRGYELVLASTPALVPPGAGGLELRFTSRTTNYDLRPDEAAFATRVLYQVIIPDLRIDETRSVVLREIETRTLFYGINVSTAADLTVLVNTTSGDVRPRGYPITVRFVNAEERESLADKLPGFDASFVLAGVAAALVVAALRRRR